MSYVFSIFHSISKLYVKTIEVETMEEVLLNMEPLHTAIEGEYDETYILDGSTVVERPMVAPAIIDTQQILKQGDLVDRSGTVDIYDIEYGGRLLASVPYLVGDIVMGHDQLDAKIWLSPVGRYRVVTTGSLKNDHVQDVDIVGGTTPIFDSTWTQVIVPDEPRLAWIEERRKEGVETVKQRMYAIWNNLTSRDTWDDSIFGNLATQAYAYLNDPDRDTNYPLRYQLLAIAMPRYGTTPLQVANSVITYFQSHASYRLAIYLHFKTVMLDLDQVFESETHVNTLVTNFLLDTEEYLL